MIDRDGRVVHEIEVALPREEVFEFFTDPERLVRWIGLSASLSATPGGHFRFEIQPGQFCEGSYVEVDRPELVSFTWGWTDPAWHLPPGSSLVSVGLTPIRSGTLVRLTHDRFPRIHRKDSHEARHDQDRDRPARGPRLGVPRQRRAQSGMAEEHVLLPMDH